MNEWKKSVKFQRGKISSENVTFEQGPACGQNSQGPNGGQYAL